MKSIIFKSLGLALFGSLVMTSCTKDFEDINKNPYQPDSTYFPNKAGQFFEAMQKWMIPYQENNYQMSENLVGANFSGYLASPGNFGGENSNTYFWKEGWIDSPFNNMLQNMYGGYLEVKKSTDAASLENLSLADIVKIAGVHRITDLYGPIPYSKGGTGDKVIPYDSQEAVYRKMILDLTHAVNFLYDYSLANPDARPMRTYDLIFKGNMASWARFGNTLKLRLAVRMAYVLPTFAQQCAEEAVNHPAGLIETNDQMVALPCEKNPLNIMWDSYADTRMGASMQSIMGGYEDPRLAKYFQPATVEGAPYKYLGVRNGILNPTKDNYLKYSSPNVMKGDPLMVMNCAESFFLRAEGALRGWNMGGDAQSLYEAGVNASFGMYGLSATAYLADDTKVPMDYKSTQAQSPNAAALSTITIKWDDAAGFERNLERIITQKWIALYPIGQEAWTEFRRTGYPKIFPVIYNSNTATINTDIQVRRFPFPPAEYKSNPSSMAQAIAYLGGADNGGTRVWWDKK